MSQLLGLLVTVGLVNSIVYLEMVITYFEITIVRLYRSQATRGGGAIHKHTTTIGIDGQRTINEDTRLELRRHVMDRQLHSIITRTLLVDGNTGIRGIYLRDTGIGLGGKVRR